MILYSVVTTIFAVSGVWFLFKRYALGYSWCVNYHGSLHHDHGSVKAFKEARKFDQAAATLVRQIGVSDNEARVLLKTALDVSELLTLVHTKTCPILEKLKGNK